MFTVTLDRTVLRNHQLPRHLGRNRRQNQGQTAEDNELFHLYLPNLSMNLNGAIIRSAKKLFFKTNSFLREVMIHFVSLNDSIMAR